MITGNFRRRFVLHMKIPVSLAQRRETFQHTRIMLLFPYLVIKTVNAFSFVRPWIRGLQNVWLILWKWSWVNFLTGMMYTIHRLVKQAYAQIPIKWLPPFKALPGRYWHTSVKSSWRSYIRTRRSSSSSSSIIQGRSKSSKRSKRKCSKIASQAVPDPSLVGSRPSFCKGIWSLCFYFWYHW